MCISCQRRKTVFCERWYALSYCIILHGIVLHGIAWNCMELHGIKPSGIKWYFMALHPIAAFFGYFTQARKLNLWWWEEPGLNVFETVFQEICKFHWRSRSNLNIWTLWSFQTFFIIQSQSCNCEKCTVHKFPLYQREILCKISLGRFNGLNVVVMGSSLTAVTPCKM